MLPSGRRLAFPHTRHATLLDVVLHFLPYVTLRRWTFSFLSTHTSCYAAGRSLAKKIVHEALGTQNYSFVVVKCLRRLCHGILTTNLLKKNKNAQIGQFHHHPVIV